ncbi:NAD(P)/FAD-dependent oxidoreductase [Jeotgalibacillus sp. ET6]|uniref:dihydrolipoyl dehydrogenase family protein n=1 Tax=Jeotgalibacillus sp. ET6 TaxID=3037260 RepID=UPI002418ADA4|nr:NAD(P)/FAD-dependent oxidoreductase [Jeotgalibacillus sp. ET6]MDG5473052.1 NAD(P)/FAD-dependent oxidoreductase [Jeotgalibacillus sp. ET6]
MVVGEIAEEKDVVVIGGGPGGYQAAIRAAQLGRKVTLIEKENVGGVCLFTGCIPSKLFAEAGKKRSSLNSLSRLGIAVREDSFDLSVLQSTKQKVIAQLQSGIEKLIHENRIERIKGSAYFLANDRIGVESGHTFSIFRFSSAIIAAGCSIAGTKESEDHRLLDYESIYALQEVPKHLAVIGDDYLALEAASSFQQLGAKVTLVVEKEDFHFEASINKELKRIFKKRNIKMHFNQKVQQIDSNEEEIKIVLEGEDGQTSSLLASHMVKAASREPNSFHLGADRLKMKTGKNGHILINDACQTSIEGIYAVGDITEGPALAVKAIKQGKVAAEVIAGCSAEYDGRFLPLILHTNPPVSSCGLTEDEAKEMYKNSRTASFPLAALGISAVTGNREGMVTVIIDEATDVLLGLHAIGEGAVELAASSVLALEMAGRTEDLTFGLYAHPSVSEGLLEAVEALTGKSIHLAAGQSKINV